MSNTAIAVSRTDIIWSYAGVVLSMGSNLLMLPFIVFFLDGETLGLWYVFTSIGGLTSLFDFGFSVTFARNVTYAWSGAAALEAEGVSSSAGGGPNYRLLNRVMATCKVIYLLIASVALLIIILVGTPYVAAISSGIEGMGKYLAWLFYALAIFLNLYYGYYAAFLRGVGDVAGANKNTVVARLAQILLTVLLLFSGLGIVGASAAYLVYGTLFRLLGRRRFLSYHGIGDRLKEVREPVRRDEVVSLFWIVWHNAWRDGLVSLSNYLCGQASTIICSLFLSLSDTGVYSLGVQAATAVMNVSATLYTAYQPKLQSSFVEGDEAAMRRDMSVIVVSYVMLFIVGTMLVSFVGLPLLVVLKPESAVPLGLYLGVSAYQFVLGFRNCYTSYFSCTNRIVYAGAFVLSSTACVALQFLLTGLLGWGPWGLIAAQMLSQASFNAWYWPMKANWELGLRWGDMPRMAAVAVKAAFRGAR